MRMRLTFFLPGLAVFGTSIIAFAFWVGGKSSTNLELAYFAGIPGMAFGASLMLAGVLAVRRPRVESAAQKESAPRPGTPAPLGRNPHDSIPALPVIGLLLGIAGGIMLMCIGILLMSGIIPSSLYLYIFAGAALLLIGQLILRMSKSPVRIQAPAPVATDLVPENMIRQATIDDKQLCYLCGKQLNVEELPVRVCAACRS